MKSSKKRTGPNQRSTNQNNQGEGRRVVTPHKSIHNDKGEGKRKRKTGMFFFE